MDWERELDAYERRKEEKLRDQQAKWNSEIEESHLACIGVLKQLETYESLTGIRDQLWKAGDVKLDQWPSAAGAVVLQVVWPIYVPGHYIYDAEDRERHGERATRIGYTESRIAEDSANLIVDCHENLSHLGRFWINVKGKGPYHSYSSREFEIYNNEVTELNKGMLKELLLEDCEKRKQRDVLPYTNKIKSDIAEVRTALNKDRKLQLWFNNNPKDAKWVESYL